MEKLLVSVPEAAQMLGIGRTLVFELINEGKLETRKIASRRLVLVSSIRDLAQAA